jgi:DNA-binding response OmpR family regulator
MHVVQTVLVIEDEIILQLLLYDVLSDAGYRVLQAHDGAQGLHLALSDRPHLIILHFGLPVQSGVQILGRLKEDRATRRIPVLAVTGESASLGAGPLPLDGWLPKPFDIDALLMQVDRLADLSAPPGQQVLVAPPVPAGARAEKG